VTNKRYLFNSDGIDEMNGPFLREVLLF